jgi:hypothetical protein
MKTRLVPLYFDPGRDSDFDTQLTALRSLLADEADILPPLPLGSPLPEADGVVLPQLLGEAYRRVEAFQAIHLPILIATSEFGTLSMWDWEIMAYLKSRGVASLAPYNLRQTRQICNALRVKRELQGAKFLVYQDNPGEGAQASIFKRFYWWEDECSQRMRERFGVTVVRKSLRELGSEAERISDAEADRVLGARPVASESLSAGPLRSAVKLYLAVRRDLERDPAIRAAGMNCLNESHFLDTTPCLAWNLFYQDRKLVWGCEADTLSMLTQYLLQHSLGAPIMMTNLYPFLLGQAALHHERIDRFPDVADPENHLLVAHCGYFGLLPEAFASEWMLRKKVLGIVDENATAIDARMPPGDVTLAKLGPTLKEMTLAEGCLTGYAQYPQSDCRNGGVVRVRDGRKFMNSLCSHHYLLMTGHQRAEIELLGKVFDLKVEEI